MAGRRRRVVEKNYSEIIAKEQEILKKLESEKADIISKIKEKKSSIKQLEKDKVRYDEQKAEEAKAQKLREVAELIAESDKSLEEIKAFLSHSDTKPNTTVSNPQENVKQD